MPNTLNTERPIKRHQTLPVQVGPIIIGGDAPVAVQSMTDTDTADINKTVTQTLELVEAGSELVRITVNTPEAAKAVPHIREKLDAAGCFVPLIGDFHYNGDQQLTQYPDCARALAKYRINPGNVGFGQKRDDRFNTIIACAIKYNKPVRIGVNWGSLDKQLATAMMDENARLPEPKPAQAVLQEALVTSALTSADAARQQGLSANKIIISCKVSVVQDLVAVYRLLAERCTYPLHLGLTEAGMGDKGIIASTAGMAILLQHGIGDTIRTSLTPAPGMPRSREVTVSQQILQSLGLRSFAPSVTACPGCGRTTSTYFRELTQTVEQYIRQNMANWRCRYPGVERMTVAVMGCIVNGPGESKHANIGISLPGTGESPIAPVFMDGKKVATLRGEQISQQFLALIDQYIKTKY